MQDGVRVVEVPWDDPRAVAMRAEMDVEMGARYDGVEGSDSGSRALHIDPADIAATCLALDADGGAVAHGALRRLRGELEVKRVIVLPAARGHGVSYRLMGWLENRARELGATRLILHTGSRQPDAVHVYETLGYVSTPVYPPYDQLPLSLCFAKDLA